MPQRLSSMENYFLRNFRIGTSTELLARRMEKLRYHMKALKTLKELKTQVYQESDIDTDCIVSFDLIERDKLRQYIENPYLYSRVQHTQTLPQEQRGLTIGGNEFLISKISILWQKKALLRR